MKWTLKRIDYRRILSSLCLVLRSIQNFLARPLLLRLLWLRSLIMLVVLILYFCFMSPLSSSAAFASEPTPTATFHPMFPSPTPGDPFTCPIGTPYGLGTVTPNPAWNALCGRCGVTAIPTMTPYWDGTVTPPANCTPVAVPVGERMYCNYGGATPTPTAFYSAPTPTGNPISCGAGAYNCQAVNSYTVRNISGDNFAFYKSQNNLPLYVTVTGLNLTTWGNRYENKATVYQYLQLQHTVNQNYHYFENIGFNNSVGNYQGGEWWYRTFSKDDLAGVMLDSGSANLWNYDYTAVQLAYGDQISGYGNTKTYSSGSVVITVSTMPSSEPTPTPLPTSTPDPSYCSYVDGTGDGKSSFQLPVILSGTPVCTGVVGGLDIPFSWFSIIGWDLPDVRVPSVQVCFEPVMFGDLVYAGKVINLDGIATILGSLTLIYILF